jgi:hypothetical protein
MASMPSNQPNRILRPAHTFRGRVNRYDVLINGQRTGQVRTLTGDTWTSVPLNGAGQFMPSLPGIEATPQAAALKIARNAGEASA